MKMHQAGGTATAIKNMRMSPSRRIGTKTAQAQGVERTQRLDLAQTYKAVSQFDCQIVVKLTSDPRPENRE